MILCILANSTLAGLAPGNKVITIAKLPPISPFKALLEASAWVESSNNPNAHNRLEKATGLLQIRPIRLRDYNQRTGSRLKLKDCYNPDISKKIWLYYASQFQPHEQMQIAKAWNGRGKSNRIYWDKIKKQLKYLEKSKTNSTFEP